MTQSQLADLFGVSAPRLSLIERGKVDIRLSTLVQILEPLEMDLGSVAIAPPLTSLADVLERIAHKVLEDLGERDLADRWFGDG